WHMHGWVCVIGSALLMMYYTTVSGWMLAYFWKFLKGDFENIGEDEIGKSFDRLTGDTGMMLIFVAIVVVLGFLVLSFGVQKGLEAVNKFMMIGLFGLILALVVNSILLKGSGEGIKFYLLPDFERAAASGWTNVISQSMTQAFFTLSLGIGAMEIFGSYMSKEHALTGEAIRIISLDTFVAIMAGLIIFPACSAFGVESDQGPSLIFQTLPHIFADMNGGQVWGTLFFLFMVFASFSTVTAVFENLVRTLMDNLDWTRARSIAVNFIIVLVTGVPCVLGFNLWSDVRFFGGKDILSSEDFLVSNIILPAGSIVFMLFCTWKFGWGAEKYLEEVNTGKGIKMSGRLIPYFKYILPVITVFILIRGLI
ncbi:MAG: sodium-dependent transporter, partial [Eubacterium sp.]|nr:sodium-dependent transporter [Eubacterium sp.]